MNEPLRLVILISGSGSNLQAIIDAIENKQLNASIQCIISNNAEAYGIKRAINHHLDYKIIEHH